MVNSKPIGIDLFAGAGGLSYGLSRAGFDMKIALEKDKYAAETLKKNNPDILVFQEDIRETNPLDIVKRADLTKEDINLVAGGPPCKGFSFSNMKTRNLDNPLNNLYLEYFRYVKHLNPECFIFENVQGLRSLHKGKVKDDIISIAEDLGYKVQWEIVNSKDYGVPQERKRIIFIGTKNEIKNVFENNNENKIVTVREAISDLPKLKNGNREDIVEYSKNVNLSNYQKMMRNNGSCKVRNNKVTKNSDLVKKRYKHIPQGGNWEDIPDSLMQNYKDKSRCHSGIYYRLKWNEPSIVISNFRKCMLIHPEQNRGLSVREAARLQSFPDDYLFSGPLSSQQQQVANAVPPFLVKKIGNKLKCQKIGDEN